MRLNLLRKIFFSTFFLCLTTLLLTCCSSGKKSENSDFVTLDGKTFKLNGEDFYPMVLNYGVDVEIGNNLCWASPSNTGFGNETRDHNKEKANLKFKADMQMIKDLGFNTVRLVGIAEYELKDNAIKKNVDSGKDTLVILEGETLEKYMNGMAEMFKILDEIGLKAIVLTKKMPDANPIVDEHLKKMLIRFKDEKAILAWDFFNEPLYFDQPARKKEDVFQIV